LGCLEAALRAAEPTRIMRSILSLTGSKLHVKGRDYDLSRFDRVFVVGGGKAAASMATSLEKLLRDRITEGYVNIPRGAGSRIKTQRIKLNEASHPIPDKSGLNGVRRMLDILKDVTSRDLVICLLSGGASALMPYPIRGITLRDKQLMTEIMLKSGSTINELNCVRKHLSYVKGGGLARAAFPATILTLALSDVVGDPMDTIASGPTSPDPSTFASAIQILKNRKVWKIVPESVKKVLREGVSGKISETPKQGDEVFRKVSNMIMGNNRTVCTAAAEHAESLGAQAIFLTSLLEGEAKEVGIVISAIPRELAMNRTGLKKPTAVIMGGETTVEVRGNGLGGRNQEMMLCASIKLERCEGIAVASIGTDGLDGNTPAAGAIVDGYTVRRARAAGMEPASFLWKNDSYRFFMKLRDAIITGPTGTNLNDVTVATVA